MSPLVTEETVDPADVLLICGYYANLPKFRVVSVYRTNGKNYVDVAPASDPADITSYRFAVVEQNHQGSDVEVLSITEIEWSDSTRRYECGDEPDCEHKSQRVVAHYGGMMEDPVSYTLCECGAGFVTHYWLASKTYETRPMSARELERYGVKR